MTNVTNLSREIAAEIQSITGRNITVDDYLRIRERAGFEIENGLYSNDTFKNESFNFNKLVIGKSKTYEPEPIKRDLKHVPTNESQYKNTKEVPQNMEQESWFKEEEPDDPFFAMCNKF